MKKIYLLVSFAALAITGSAQSLLKDLNPGVMTSQPEQFINVNGTMYFETNNGTAAGGSYKHTLWKSDGTAANTVIVKDSIINSNIGFALCLRANVNGNLFYSVNKMGKSAGDTTHLWKTDGTKPVLVATLPHPGYPGFGGGFPTNFTVVGNKMFFSMWQSHGLELWVTDGTTAGTKEVIDLNPGNNGAGYDYGGVKNAPMAAFNGKVYFNGNTTVGVNELYSSDGTAAGTTRVKAGVLDPENLIVFNNELYFCANSGAELWKTDGTSAGTVKVANTSFTQATIFKNALYFPINGSLWKTDGTTVSLVKDSVGGLSGATSDYFFTSYMKSLPAPPYYQIYYWKSDGTTAGTVRVSDSLGKAASFVVVNNKMYNSTGYNLWESDGTEAGTKNILSGVPGIPYAFKNALFFSNFQSSTGYELWSMGTVSTTGMEENIVRNGSQIFPNPSAGKFQISSPTIINKDVQVTVYNLLGKVVYSKTTRFDNVHSLDLSDLTNGVYILTLASGQDIQKQKLIIQK